MKYKSLVPNRDLPPMTPPASDANLDLRKIVAICIDDEQDILDILKDELELLGITVHCFSEAQKALAQVENLQPDLILSDITMPNMTGLQFLARVREFKNHYPVVFCSGNLSKDTLVEAINYGAGAVIEKPFNVPHLITTILNTAGQAKLVKVMEQTIGLLMFQHTDFDDYLKLARKDELRIIFAQQLTEILEQRKLLRSLKHVTSA